MKIKVAYSKMIIWTFEFDYVTEFKQFALLFVKTQLFC